MNNAVQKPVDEGAHPFSAAESGTQRREYAEYLEHTPTWKRLLNVQLPYRWNVRRLCSGIVLDIGCGTGRNLTHLRGAAVGVDHNQHSVEIAKRRGFIAFSPQDFMSSCYATGSCFDTLLIAHVLEHMSHAEACDVVGGYLSYLKTGGDVVIICPQERGYASDATHVEFFNHAAGAALMEKLQLKPVKFSSFPFPRPIGKVFKYNEFVMVGRKMS